MPERETVYQLNPAIPDDDFRIIARKRLVTQDQEFQDKWHPLIDDIDPRGRLMGYTAVWTAMEVRENWQSAIAKNSQPDRGGV